MYSAYQHKPIQNRNHYRLSLSFSFSVSYRHHPPRPMHIQIPGSCREQMAAQLTTCDSTMVTLHKTSSITSTYTIVV